jgi:flagellar hook assembly protein FlgD
VPLTLYQNSPNPFNPSTEIRYYLPERCSVALDIYDVNGALVANLLEGYRDKGTHTVSWDGRDRNGRQMTSGVYFYRLKAGKTEVSRKMVLAR